MAWNNSNSETTKAPIKRKAPSAWRGAIGGLVVVAIAGVAFFMVTREMPKPATHEKSDSSIAEKKRKYRSAKEISPVKERKQYETKAKTVEEALARVEESQDPIKIETIKTPATGKGKRLFNTGTEQLLSWICHVELGEMPMPIPPIGEEDMANIAAILVSKNEITKDDTPEQAEAKRMVDAAKKEMIKFIKEGGNPNEFMQYCFQEQNKAFEKRNEAQAMVEELKEEDPKLARDFVKKVNEKLSAEGIKPITFDDDEVDAEQ